MLSQTGLETTNATLEVILNTNNLIFLLKELATFKNAQKVFYRWENEYGFIPTTFSFSQGIDADQVIQLKELNLPDSYIDALKFSNGIKFFQHVDSSVDYAGQLLPFDEVIAEYEFAKKSNVIKTEEIGVFQIQDTGIVAINVNKTSDNDKLPFVLPDGTALNETMFDFLNNFILYSGRIPVVEQI